MGTPFEKLTPKLQNMILQQGAAAPKKPAYNFGPVPVSEIKLTGTSPAKKRLKQSTKPLLNALESRFLDRLHNWNPEAMILAQAVRFELARGIWYKPDFVVPKAGWSTDKDGIRVSYSVAYEVKGPKAFRGGFENLKVAARVHHWIKFFLVWEDRTQPDGWARQEILP